MSDVLSFVGAGKMAEALARSICAKKAWPRRDILAADPKADRRDVFHTQLQLRTTPEEREAIAKGSVIILAVKPQVLPGVLKAHGPLFTPEKLVISIAAGYPIAKIEASIGSERRLPIIRVMPNLAATVGAAASAYYPNGAVTKRHRQVAERLLGSAGLVVEVEEERHLDAVTGVSGSGPAFVALVIEALADGGVLAGLPRDKALVLAAQTALGAAKLVLQGQLHPALLKDMVCTPAGTTVAGMRALERAGARSAFIEAVKAAADRATELGK